TGTPTSRLLGRAADGRRFRRRDHQSRRVSSGGEFHSAHGARIRGPHRPQDQTGRVPGGGWGVVTGPQAITGTKRAGRCEEWRTDGSRWRVSFVCLPNSSHFTLVRGRPPVKLVASAEQCPSAAARPLVAWSHSNLTAARSPPPRKAAAR